MIVGIINKILERYSLCENGIIVQFVTHKNGSFYADEIHEDAILVTPINKDGEPNHFRQCYFHCSQFKDWEKRDAFRILAREHNIKTQDKRFGVPIFVKGNYCTIQ